jgi:hypothetical protein
MILKLFTEPASDTPITDAWDHPDLPLFYRPADLCRQLERAANAAKAKLAEVEAAAEVARFEHLIRESDLERKIRNLEMGVCLDRTPRVKSIEEFFTLFAS